jgi:hypothetical protein
MIDDIDVDAFDLQRFAETLVEDTREGVSGNAESSSGFFWSERKMLAGVRRLEASDSSNLCRT